MAPPPPHCEKLLNFSPSLPSYFFDKELKTLETVNVSQCSYSFKPFSKPDIWFCGNQVPSFYSYLKWFESLSESRSKLSDKAV